MKNRGFTLVEVLAILGILAVLSLLAMPTINNQIKKNKEKLLEAQIKTIASGLQTWGVGVNLWLCSQTFLK